MDNSLQIDNVQSFVEVICDNDNLWNLLVGREVSRFQAEITYGIKGKVLQIQNIKHENITHEEILISINYKNEFNVKFDKEIFIEIFNIAQKFYQSYLQYLQATGEDDFDGLMQKAATTVASGQTVFRRKSGTGDLKCLRYILIDEYQDFSELFHHLIEAIREQNPQAQFFCVGDDWQAINGFAGSDLRFYQNFAQFFQHSQKLNIATNYRSAL